MNNPRIIVITLLYMAAFPPYSHAVEQSRDGVAAQQMHSDSECSRECLTLRDAINDELRAKMLLWDQAEMHNMLRKPELRREILQHPHYLQLMMQNPEMRQELLGNEEMMREMLRSPDGYREITRNREMVEEIEKNDKYRHIYKKQQTDILDELLLEPTPSGNSPTD